eukprot:752068-Hanusia_phi.AAC.4
MSSANSWSNADFRSLLSDGAQNVSVGQVCKLKHQDGSTSDVEVVRLNVHLNPLKHEVMMGGQVLQVDAAALYVEEAPAPTASHKGVWIEYKTPAGRSYFYNR